MSRHLALVDLHVYFLHMETRPFSTQWQSQQLLNTAYHPAHDPRFSHESQKWILTVGCFESGSKQGPSLAFGEGFCCVSVLRPLPTSPAGRSRMYWGVKLHKTNSLMGLDGCHTHATTTLIQIWNVLSPRKFPSCPSPVRTFILHCSLPGHRNTI